MAVLSVQQIDVDGLIDPTFGAAAAGGDSFTNDKNNKTFLVVKNGGGAGITVTIDDTGSVAPSGAVAFNPDVDITVGAGSEAWIGPFGRARFGSSVGITYSDVTSVTVAALRV